MPPLPSPTRLNILPYKPCSSLLTVTILAGEWQLMSVWMGVCVCMGNDTSASTIEALGSSWALGRVGQWVRLAKGQTPCVGYVLQTENSLQEFP